MNDRVYALDDAALDTVTGATSYQEAFANMARWNAAITAAGNAGIEGGSHHPRMGMMSEEKGSGSY